MLAYLHALGMVSWFGHELPELRQLVVLDPQWLIDLISRIIRVYDDDLHKLDCDDEAQRQTLKSVAARHQEVLCKMNGSRE